MLAYLYALGLWAYSLLLTRDRHAAPPAIYACALDATGVLLLLLVLLLL